MIDADSSLSLVRRSTLDLPRLLMRRALGVAAFVLLAALMLGFVRAVADIDDETRSAIALADALIRVADAQALPDAELLGALDDLQGSGRLRHLTLRLRDADGRLLLAPAARPDSGWLAPLVWLHAIWQGDAPAERLSWPVGRADGRTWTLELETTGASERREAMAGLALAMSGVCAGVALAMGALAWQIRRVFAPLASLLAGIERMERGDASAAASLPTMPIRELQSIAVALRRLDDALRTAEQQRRVLGQQVLSLQEDERTRVAQELHDEFGQRLTALRVDASWLRKRLVAAGAEHALTRVIDGMDAQCERIQHDLRALLTRLSPLGVAPGGADVPVGRLGPLLRALVAAWAREGSDRGPRIELELRIVDASGREHPWPDEAGLPAMPRELQLAVYRISQEGLTNVARHARAQRAWLSITLRSQGCRAELAWRLADDGIGVSEPRQAMQRGNGLAGIRERAWARGAALSIGPALGDAQCPGLELAASFVFELDAASAAALAIRTPAAAT